MKTNIEANDDCNINVLNTTDIALEMTRMYLEYYSSSHYIGEDLIFNTYKNFKKKLDQIEEESEDENED